MEYQNALLLSCSRPWPWLLPQLSSGRLPGFRQQSRAPYRLVAALGGGDAEEQRWLREEQRWLREEQRWLREEARWHTERKSMAAEYEILKNEVEQLRALIQERRNYSSNIASLPSVVASLKQLVQSLSVEERPDIEFAEEEFEPAASTGSLSDRPSNLGMDASEPASISFDTSASIPSMSEFSIDLVAEVPAETAPMRSKGNSRELKKGVKGEELKALQEALEALGFYPGEEDMEYSMFSSGTESAVKSWQASIGVQDNGIVSPELLATLLGKTSSKVARDSSKAERIASTSQKAQPSDPWRAPASAPQASGINDKQTFAENKRSVEDSHEDDIAPNRRVFLLGENRWEEPSRLLKPKTNGASSSLARKSVEDEKCFSCRGEGVTMCTECEGTGELNVEDQFLDWVEEGAKCPYCEGSGAVACEVCSGLGAIPQV